MTQTQQPVRAGRLALQLPLAFADDWASITAELEDALTLTRYELLGTPSQWIRTNGPGAEPVLHVECDITQAGEA